MIVITNPTAITNEIEIIHSLFAEGLSLLHVRKPEYSVVAMKSFLKAVGLEFKHQMVLHHHHHEVAEEFEINRLHFPKQFRNTNVAKKEASISTSTHSISEFNALEKEYDYAFLSPVFPSISKTGYSSEMDHIEAVKQRTNCNTKLIALGGISAENAQLVLTAGFDDVALLGAIWNTTNPLENFKRCQQIVLSF
ncbi:MAG: thiamine phosphate synthase [Bacteroidota bacterium]